MDNHSTTINKMNNHLSSQLIEHKQDHSIYHIGNTGPGTNILDQSINQW